MKKVFAVISMVISLIGLAGELRADAVTPCSPDTATMLPVSDSGVPLEFTGTQVSRAEMARLWEITTTRSDAYLYLGKVIGEGQDWFGTCQFPGLGIATGSGGGDWMRRYVALWVWADGVDLAAARASVYTLIADVVAATTTTTALTTTTTTTTISTTTLPEPTTTTTTTTAVALETTTTAAAAEQATTTSNDTTPVTLGVISGYIAPSSPVESTTDIAVLRSATAVSVAATTVLEQRPTTMVQKPKLKIVKSLKKAKVTRRVK